MAQATRIEVRQTKTRYKFIAQIIEVRVESGSTKAILVTLEDDNYADLQFQVKGAMDFITSGKTYDDIKPEPALEEVIPSADVKYLMNQGLSFVAGECRRSGIINDSKTDKDWAAQFGATDAASYKRILAEKLVAQRAADAEIVLADQHAAWEALQADQADETELARVENALGIAAPAAGNRQFVCECGEVVETAFASVTHCDACFTTESERYAAETAEILRQRAAETEAPAKPEKCKDYKKQKSGAWITKQRRLAIYLRDGFACAYCGCDLKNARPMDINLDHLTPRYDGGGNESSNLITACKSCNSSRGIKPYSEYATGGALARIERQRWLEPNVQLAKALIAGTTGNRVAEAAR